MQQINLTDIDSQRAEIDRARRVAQMLQEQASAPIQSVAGPGVVAPISPLQGLASMLAQYGALRKEKKAAEAEKQANELERQQANEFMANLDRSPDTASEMIDTGVPTANLKPGLMEALKNRITGGSVPQMPNKPVLGQGDFVAPRPAMGTGAMAPAPGATITPGQGRSPQEKLAMLMQASTSGNKILQNVTPALYAEALKDRKADKVFSSITRNALDAGADPATLEAYKAAGDYEGGVKYLSNLGLKKEEVKATMAELEFKSQDKALDRQSREQIAAENRADRQEARAQAHADRMMIANMANTKLKPAPVKVQQDYAGNLASAAHIDTALGLVTENSPHFGLKFQGGDWINQRLDPNGTDARAAVSNIGSLIVHDRSGAAVTVGETPRLRPFIPSVIDNPKVVRQKLRSLKRSIEEENSAFESIYNEDNGYKAVRPEATQAPGKRLLYTTTGELVQ